MSCEHTRGESEDEDAKAVFHRSRKDDPPLAAGVALTAMQIECAIRRDYRAIWDVVMRVADRKILRACRGRTWFWHLSGNVVHFFETSPRDLPDQLVSPSF